MAESANKRFNAFGAHSVCLPQELNEKHAMPNYTVKVSGNNGISRVASCCG
jgi:hypothetical protein